MGRHPKTSTAEIAGLAALFGPLVPRIAVRHATKPDVGVAVTAGTHRFAMVSPPTSGVGAIAQGATAAKALARKLGRRTIALVAVPFNQRPRLSHHGFLSCCREREGKPRAPRRKSRRLDRSKPSSP